MLLAIYFIAGIILSGLIFIFPWRESINIFTMVFIIIQILFSIFAFTMKDQTDLRYFTYDSLAMIFLIILSLISSATFFTV